MPDCVCVFFDLQDNPVNTVQEFFEAIARRAREQARPSARLQLLESAGRHREEAERRDDRSREGAGRQLTAAAATLEQARARSTWVFTTGGVGPARLRTSNGPVRVEDLRGRLDVQTSNGRVEVAGEADGTPRVVSGVKSLVAENGHWRGFRRRCTKSST